LYKKICAKNEKEPKDNSSKNLNELRKENKLEWDKKQEKFNEV
jgi:hypothetical protein